MAPGDGGLDLAWINEVILFLSWSSIHYFLISLFQSWSSVQEIGQFIVVAGSGTQEDPYILRFLQVSQHSSQILLKCFVSHFMMSHSSFLYFHTFWFPQLHSLAQAVSVLGSGTSSDPFILSSSAKFVLDRAISSMIKNGLIWVSNFEIENQ